jgi:4'-phosphopantetheinyl transferase EntD
VNGSVRLTAAARGAQAAAIAELLPGEAIAVETRAEVLAVELFPEERAAVARSVEKRRREYVAARACARAALAALGLPPAPILNGERGQPLWPEGLVGSITHCAGYRACAVARATQLAALGIDAEPDEPLPEGVLARVARSEERPMLAELARAAPAVSWERLLFSAKEAVYKAWFPLAACWLGFEDAVLTIDPRAGTFHARLLKPWPEGAAERVGASRGEAGPGEASRRGWMGPEVLEGRWAAREGLVLSAVALPA